MYKRSKSVKIYECWMKHPNKPAQHGKFFNFASKHVGRNFVLEQTSSNIIQDDFFLLFQNFINFVIAQTITFHPTWQKRVGLVCISLKLTVWFF